MAKSPTPIALTINRISATKKKVFFLSSLFFLTGGSDGAVGELKEGVIELGLVLSIPVSKRSY